MYPHERTFRARGSLGAEYLPFNDDKALPATLPLSPTKCTHTRACAGLLKQCACPLDDDENAAPAILPLSAAFLLSRATGRGGPPARGALASRCQSESGVRVRSTVFHLAPPPETPRQAPAAPARPGDARFQIRAGPACCGPWHSISKRWPAAAWLVLTPRRSGHPACYISESRACPGSRALGSPPPTFPPLSNTTLGIKKLWDCF